jgi:ElaB/YqjD/DUF883 family membrane-anchored ribosome-binding protein
VTPESHSAGTADASHAVGDDLKQDAARLKQTVGKRARQEAESRKGQATQVAGSASSALNSAAEKLKQNPDAPDWMASALQQTARKIESFSSHVEGRSVEELGRDISEFARRNPGTFLAASAAVGFAVARVLRAGVDRQRHDCATSQQAGLAGQGDISEAGGQTMPISAASADTWVADENIMPTDEGSFAPAYSAEDPSLPGGVR